MTIAEVMKAIQTVDAKITAQVKLGTKRDKKIIKALQAEHFGLTKQLAGLHEPDGDTPVDKTDTSGKEFKKAKAVRTPNEVVPVTETLDAQTEAYCQKCKAKQIMLTPVASVSPKGKNMLKGNCRVCNRKIFKFVKKN